MHEQAESSHVTEPAPTGWRARLLWTSLITPPAVALGDLQLGYTLTLFACSREVRLLPIASTMAALLCVAAALVYAWRFDPADEPHVHGDVAALADMHRPPPHRPETAMGWVAIMAVGLNVVALLLIVGMAIPRLMLDPCAR